MVTVALAFEPRLSELGVVGFVERFNVFRVTSALGFGLPGAFLVAVRPRNRVSWIRVVVVEDHPMFRNGLVAMLDELDGMEVVGQAATGEQADELAAALDPDVVLMDLHLPGISGVEATSRITTRQPRVAVLVLTMLDDDSSILGAMRAGARGYLLKEAAPEEIVRAVEAVAAGQAVFGGAAAARMLATLRSLTEQPRPLPMLTDREAEVLELMAKGLTNASIAERLYLSDKTVRNHVSNIFTKLGVSDRGPAVARARDVGLGTP